MKLYGEKEIGEILKKAAENSAGDNSGTGVGLSIDELQRLASEAGIDPDQISRAVAEIDLESRNGKRSFWGGPFSFGNQVIVDHEITDAEWEEMLVSIRKSFKSKGVVSTRQSVLEWSSPWGTTNAAHVTAAREDGKTKISVFWNGPLTAFPYYVPVPLAAVASLLFASEFLELSAVPGFSFVLLITGLTFLAGRTAVSRHLDKLFSRFREMMVGFKLSSPGGGATTDVVSNQSADIESEAPAPKPLLDLDEQNDGEGDFPRLGHDRSRER